jgi:hypothetical protein
MLWVLANTCSVLILLYLLGYLLQYPVIYVILAVVLVLYGLEGLILFRWQNHPSIIVPQVLHITMITAGVLQILRMSRVMFPYVIAGVVAGLLIRAVQRRCLNSRNDTQAFLDDPVIGAVFRRITKISKSGITKG